MTPNSTNSKVSRQTVAVGLVISLLLPSLYVMVVLPYLVKPNVEGQVENIIGLVFLWILTVWIFVYVRFFEKRSFSSIGVKSIGIKRIALAVIIGLLCSLLIPLFYFSMTFLTNTPTGNAIESLSQQTPVFMFASIITAACTEEVLFRAYPLERLYELTGSNWLGILLSLGAFVLLHAQSWNLMHILGVVLPLGIVLTIIYLKTRNLLFVIIVHLVIDFPLFISSLINQLNN
jgi:membrane protease YdiL (CAAX protease family)